MRRNTTFWDTKKYFRGKVIVDLFFWWEIAKTDLRGGGRGFFVCGGGEAIAIA